MVSVQPIVDVVRRALLAFSTKVEESHNVKVSDQVWSSSTPQSGGCPVLLKTGARTGQPCGKNIPAGKSACSAHSRGGATPVNTGTPAPKPSGIKEQAVFRRTAFGNYACEGMVVDKLTKGIYGREDKDGKIIPLTADDKRRCVQLGLQISEKKEEVKEESKEVEEEPVDDSESIAL